MRIAPHILIASLFASIASICAASPVIDHVPVTKAVRGVPAHIVATIESVGSTLTSVVTQVRLAPAGTPTDFKMVRGEKNAFDAEIPVTLFRGVNRFWYSISAWDSESNVSSTVWLPVRVVDGANVEKAGAGGSLFASKRFWIGAGALVAAGVTTAVLLDDDDDGEEPEPIVDATPAPTPKPAPAPKSPSKPKPTPEPPAPEPCIVTGAEVVSFDQGSLDPFNSRPILLWVCNTCTTAAIRAVGSWGQEVNNASYVNPDCDPLNELQLPKPVSTSLPNPGQYTIDVFANSVLISTTNWPPPGSGPF